MIEDIITPEDNPNVKLIDEDKTVTISLYTYNKLMYDNFRLGSAKNLYDVTREKLDKLYNYLMKNKDLYLSETNKEKIKDIYYDIN